MAGPQYGLKAFVHRALALRLLIGCVGIAGLFGAGAYLTRFDIIGEDAVTHAINGVERLRARVRVLVEEPASTTAAAVQRALDDGPDHRVESRHGRFVFVRFYAADGTIFAQHAGAGGPAPAQLEAFLKQSPLRFPAADEPLRATVDIGGRPLIDVVLAIPDRRGSLVAYGEGLFALSAAAIAGARQAALKTAGYVVFIVLATSLLLYPVILTLTRRLAGFSERLLAANLETVQALGSAIARRDSDTDAHNFRVTLYTAHLAEAAGLGAGQIRALLKGAFLHDVGKIGVRDRILHKPGKLDADEFAIMKTHVDHGLEITRRSDWLADAADVIGAHHENSTAAVTRIGCRARRSRWRRASSRLPTSSTRSPRADRTRSRSLSRRPCRSSIRAEARTSIPPCSTCSPVWPGICTRAMADARMPACAGI